jgi:hypothetical protein
MYFIKKLRYQPDLKRICEEDKEMESYLPLSWISGERNQAIKK